MRGGRLERPAIEIPSSQHHKHLENRSRDDYRGPRRKSFRSRTVACGKRVLRGQTFMNVHSTRHTNAKIVQANLCHFDRHSVAYLLGPFRTDLFQADQLFSRIVARTALGHKKLEVSGTVLDGEKLMLNPIKRYQYTQRGAPSLREFVARKKGPQWGKFAPNAELSVGSGQTETLGTRKVV